jgi:hypothetical protein
MLPQPSMHLVLAGILNLKRRKRNEYEMANGTILITMLIEEAQTEAARPYLRYIRASGLPCSAPVNESGVSSRLFRSFFFFL